MTRTSLFLALSLALPSFLIACASRPPQPTTYEWVPPPDPPPSPAQAEAPAPETAPEATPVAAEPAAPAAAAEAPAAPAAEVANDAHARAAAAKRPPKKKSVPTAATPTAQAPPPPPTPEVPPARPTRYSGDNPCRGQVDAAGPIGKACARGGIPAAKTAMKDLVRRGRAVGASYECDDCHRDDIDYSQLAPNARQQLEKLLAAVK